MRLLPFICSANLVAAGQLTERALSYARDLEGTKSFARRNSDNIKRSQQEPLIAHNGYDGKSDRRWARLEIETASFLGFVPFYWTNIALGTPSQPFRTILDMSYGGALVRSEFCLDMSCARGFNYSSSASSTYHDEKERFLLHLPAQYIRGNVSRDHMQLAGMNITDVIFGSIDDFYGENFVMLTMANFADGALGLGPPNASVPVYTDTKISNILHTVVNQGVLKSNIFTLDLPSYPGSKGSLTFGIIPEEAKQSAETKVPFANSATYPGMWHFEVESLKVTGPNPTDIPLTNPYATFEFGHGFSFPENMTKDILSALDAKDTGYLFPEVSCSRWEHMPDIVFTFAGQDIAIERDRYAYKVRNVYGGEICLVMIGANSYEWQPIALGVEFMRMFYVTFDIDQKRLRLFRRTTKELEP